MFKLLPCHSPASSARGVGCDVHVHAESGPFRRREFMDQVADEVSPILGGGGLALVPEVRDGDSAETPQTQCIVLLLAGVICQVQDQPDHLIPQAHQEIALPSCQRVVILRVPEPGNSISLQHAGHKLLDVPHTPDGRQHSGRRLDEVREHVTKASKLIGPQDLVVPLIVAAPHLIFLHISEGCGADDGLGVPQCAPVLNLVFAGHTSLDIQVRLRHLL